MSSEILIKSLEIALFFAFVPILSFFFAMFICWIFWLMGFNGAPVFPAATIFSTYYFVAVTPYFNFHPYFYYTLVALPLCIFLYYLNKDLTKKSCDGCMRCTECHILSKMGHYVVPSMRFVNEELTKFRVRKFSEGFIQPPPKQLFILED